MQRVAGKKGHWRETSTMVALRGKAEFRVGPAQRSLDAEAAVNEDRRGFGLMDRELSREGKVS